MQMLHPPSLDTIAPCPYLTGREKQYKFFYAIDLDYRQVDSLLEHGWRKFGPCFFRPSCPDCQLCIPLRVDVNQFSPSRSQKRTLKKGTDLRVEWGKLHYNERIFEIYRLHSLRRFDDVVKHDDFINAFYIPACPTLQINIFTDDRQIGVGWLDLGERSLRGNHIGVRPTHLTNCISLKPRSLSFAIRHQSLALLKIGNWPVLPQTHLYRTSLQFLVTSAHYTYDTNIFLISFEALDLALKVLLLFWLSLLLSGMPRAARIWRGPTRTRPPARMRRRSWTC